MQTTFIHGTNTSDVRLVAALTAMGIPVAEINPSAAIGATAGTPGGSRVWSVGTVSNCGRYKVEQLLVAWRDVKFHETNPQHPFAFVKAALWNHKVIVDAVKRDRPLVQIRKGESIAFLHPDCSAETERKILTQFDK